MRCRLSITNIAKDFTIVLGFIENNKIINFNFQTIIFIALEKFI